ncbi:MAG: TatD family hydrolase, partial [Minisyncoccales bacterium]
MIDIHFHLDFFEKKNELIEESKESLRGIVNCALSLREAEESLGLKKKYLNFFFFTLGFHPQEEDKFSEKIFKQYEVFIKKNKKEILAIGEIGLDYADEKKDQKKMKKIF